MYIIIFCMISTSIALRSSRRRRRGQPNNSIYNDLLLDDDKLVHALPLPAEGMMGIDTMFGLDSTSGATPLVQSTPNIQGDMGSVYSPGGGLQFSPKDSWTPDNAMTPAFTPNGMSPGI